MTHDHDMPMSREVKTVIQLESPKYSRSTILLRGADPTFRLSSPPAKGKENIRSKAFNECQRGCCESGRRRLCWGRIILLLHLGPMYALPYKSAIEGSEVGNFFDPVLAN